MDAVSTPTQDTALVAAFAQRAGLDAAALMAMLTAALAAQIRAGGPMPIPLQVGLPSVQCMACPFASRPILTPPNVIAICTPQKERANK